MQASLSIATQRGYTVVSMNWLNFGIVAYVTTVLQTALVPVLLPESFQPNLFIVVAVYYLLTAQDERVLLAALVLGALADLSSLAPLGSQTVAFAVVAWFVRAIKPILFAELATAHAFAAAISFLAMLMVYRLIAAVAPGGVPTGLGVFQVALQAAATALAAALVRQFLGRRLKPGR